MHKACPLSELAPGEVLRLDTAPPIAVFHAEAGETFAIDDTCTKMPHWLTATSRTAGSSATFTHPGSTSAPSLGCTPATLPVRTHEVQTVDGNIMIIESDEAPTFRPV